MRILGVDIGSTSVKLVEVDSAFGRYEIHDYHELPITADPISDQISQYVSQFKKRPDKIVSYLKTSETTFRNLILPTRDKKAIQAGIGFELEDEVPFSIEDTLTEYSIISQHKQSTEVHVATTLKTKIEQMVRFWKNSSLSPDVITSEAWAYRSYLNRILSAEEKTKPILLIQLGHERSVLYVQWQGQPLLCRELSWGGTQLTKAISIRYQIPLEQAEQAKLDHGFVISQTSLSNLTVEQIEFANTLLEPIQTLISEIRQTTLSAKSLANQGIAKIYLTGGTSQLPGLVQCLSEQLALPVSTIKGISAIAPSGVTYAEPADAKFLLATALALSVVGGEKGHLINFRKNEFSKQGSYKAVNIKALRKPLIAVSIILVSLFSSLIVQSFVYKKRIQDLDTKLEQSIRRFFAGVSNNQVKGYLKNTKTLKTSLDKELKKNRELSKLLLPNQKSPLNYLKNISHTIPRDVIVDMTEFQVGAAPESSFLAPEAATVSLTFLFQNPQTAEKLSNLLSSKLSQMKKSPVEETAAPDGNGKRWKITLSGIASEESYGK